VRDEARREVQVRPAAEDRVGEQLDEPGTVAEDGRGLGFLAPDLGEAGERLLAL